MGCQLEIVQDGAGYGLAGVAGFFLKAGVDLGQQADFDIGDMLQVEGCLH